MLSSQTSPDKPCSSQQQETKTKDQREGIKKSLSFCLWLCAITLDDSSIPQAVLYVNLKSAEPDRNDCYNKKAAQ